MKPDASKQHEPGNVLGHQEAIDYGDGPYCWNCELTFKSMEDAPPDLPVHFCNPHCKREWLTRQPLQNFTRQAPDATGARQMSISAPDFEEDAPW